MTPFERRATLHFTDYLGRLPGGFVYERFLRRGGPGRKIVSASTIEGIRAAFSTEKNLREAFSRLARDARYIVSLAYLFGGEGVPCELVAHQPGASGEGSGASAGFDEASVASFLVYRAEDAQGKSYYMGFDEFEPKLRGLLCRVIVERARTASEKEAHPIVPGLCVSDVAAIVSLASQGDLTKTKTGQIGKVSELLVRKLLHGGRAPFDWVAGRTRPEALAVEYACRKGLMYLRDDRYVANHGRMCAWLARPAEDLRREIADFAISLLPAWRRTMVEEVCRSLGAHWLSVSAFGAELAGAVSQHVKLFAYLGLLELRKCGGDLLFRAPRPAEAPRGPAGKGRPAPRIMVLPDFTAMLPQEIEPEHLYWFARLGRIESLDKVYTGTVAREVIADSLSDGIEGAAMLGLLDRWRAPANVVETVREWIREFSQVFLETGAIVATADEKVTRRLSSFPPLAGCIEPVSAHCVFRVAKGKEALVAGILTDMGFDHRAPALHRSEGAAAFRSQAPLVADLPPAEAYRSPVVQFEKTPDAPPLVLKQGKYSSALKALDMTELMHVIEYALVMGSRLRIEYAGSPGVRKGMYLVRPLQYQKGPGSGLEAESGRACVKKIFLLERIRKVGVEGPHA
jgi:hypothetical protein